MLSFAFSGGKRAFFPKAKLRLKGGGAVISTVPIFSGCRIDQSAVLAQALVRRWPRCGI